MKNYVIYIRVSTQKQGRSGLGLESQRKICTDFATANGGQVVQEFVDVESGTHRDRKGLTQAIDYCKKNDCPLVIAKLDRLARDVEFCFKVINTGIEIHFCDMPQINTLLLGVFASVAQYERELTSDRTKKALAAKKARGEKTGGASEQWKITHSNKTKEQLKITAMKRGATKNNRHLASRDTQAFFKVLRIVFPDVCKGEPQQWEWGKITTAKGNADKILQMMKDYKEFNDTGALFRRWDFTLHERRLHQNLCAYLSNTKKSIKKHIELQK